MDKSRNKRLAVTLLATGGMTAAVLIGAPGKVWAATATTTIPVGKLPYGVAFDAANGDVYVTNSGSNSVSVIDGTTNSVTSTIPVGRLPYGVAYDAANGDVYVANDSSGSVSVINGSTNTVTSTIKVGDLPYDVAYDAANGNVYVTNALSNSVSVIDGLTNTLTSTINVGSYPVSVAYDAANGDVYVTDDNSGSVSVINGHTNTVTSTIKVGGAPGGLAYDPANGDVYVTNSGSNTASIINGSTNSITSTVTVGTAPGSVVYDAANKDLYVTDDGSNSVSVINGSTNSVTSSVTVGSLPYALAYDAANGDVYVANDGSNSVSVIAPPVPNSSVDLTFGNSDVLSGLTRTVTGVVHTVYGVSVPNAIVHLSSTIGSWSNSSVTADGSGAFHATWRAPTETTETSGTVTAAVYGTVYGGLGNETPTTLPIQVAPPPSVSTTTLASATQGSAYSQTLSATGGFPPYTWSVTSGKLPVGLTLDASTGVISGAPSAVGADSFTVQVTDSDGNKASETLSIPVFSTVSSPPVQPTLPPFIGTNGFDTVLSWIWIGPSGANWSAQGLGGTQIFVQVPNGTLNKRDVVRLTTADSATLSALTKALNHVTLLGGYGLNVANDTPNLPMELWFNNPAWIPGTMVYRVNEDGSLTWVPVETFSNGWLRFEATKASLAQGGDYVMVLPDAAKTLKVNEALLEWNGVVEDMPTVSGHEGTYGALFYVMQALKRDGMESQWNGKAWTLTVPSTVTVQATTAKPASGEIPVIVNGTTVAYMPALVEPDGWTHRPTTYVPIDALDAVLKSLFGSQPDWTYGPN